MFKINLIDLDELKNIISALIRKKKIEIRPLEPEIQPAQGKPRHYSGPKTSRDVIGLPLATTSLVTFFHFGRIY